MFLVLSLTPSFQESSAEILAAQFDPDHTFPLHTLTSDMRKKFAETVAPMLMDHPVLAKLSELQRSLDPLDIEGLSALVTGKPATEYPNESLPFLDAPEVQAPEEPTLNEWRRFIDAYFHHKFGDSLPTPANFQAFTHGMSQKRYHLLAYLLSATFKDCSIIIRGHEDDVRSAAVTIIDLDSKSLGRMGKWESLDRDVVKCTLEAEEGVEEAEKRVCVEDPVSSKRTR
jgi:inositol-pentakisphosphate 2-kinase